MASLLVTLQLSSEPLPLIVSIGVPTVFTFLTAAVSDWAQRRFFPRYIEQYGHAQREPPIIRTGLGLDDWMVGTWDVMPALRAFTTRLPIAELDAARRVAFVAWSIANVQLVLSPLEASAVAYRVSADQYLAALLKLLPMAALWYVFAPHWLYYSRPELGRLRSDWIGPHRLACAIWVALGAIVVILVGLALLVAKATGR